MPETKFVKIVHDGKDYWLLWHWEALLRANPTFDTTAKYINGPFRTLEGAATEAAKSKSHGWTVIPYPPSTH